MRKRDRERYERLLLDERERLRAQRGELEESARRSIRDASGESAYSQHTAGAGTDAMEREQTLMLVSAVSRTLEETEDALRKIATDEYGVCEACGQPIAAKRLQALPYARLCLACQEALDRGGGSASRGTDHP